MRPSQTVRLQRVPSSTGALSLHWDFILRGSCDVWEGGTADYHRHNYEERILLSPAVYFWMPRLMRNWTICFLWLVTIQRLAYIVTMQHGDYPAFSLISICVQVNTQHSLVHSAHPQRHWSLPRRESPPPSGRMELLDTVVDMDCFNASIYMEDITSWIIFSIYLSYDIQHFWVIEWAHLGSVGARMCHWELWCCLSHHKQPGSTIDYLKLADLPIVIVPMEHQQRLIKPLNAGCVSPSWFMIFHRPYYF